MTLPPRGNGLALPRGATVLRFPSGKRFSGGDIRGTPLPRGATVLRCPEGQRFCVSPRGNGFPEASFEGHRCPEGQRFCVAPTVFRRRHSRDTVAPRGNGFALPRGATVFRRRHSGTPLRLFTVGRIVYETGYFPVSRATFGCRVRISHETYTIPGHHLRDGITTGHPRQRWERMGVRENGCFS